MNTTAKVVIGFSGLAVTVFTIHAIIKTNTDKVLLSKLHAILDERENATGLIDDFNDILTGQPYLDNLNQKLTAKGKYFIMLNRDAITKYRTMLYDAISGLGTNWNEISQVFTELKDKVAIAQVAQSYLQNYKETLLSALNGDLDDSQNKDLVGMITKKMNYRLTN